MRAQKKKRFDKLGPWPGLSPERARELMKARQEKIAFGLDPSVPDVGMPTVSEFIENEYEWLLKKYKKQATVKSQIKCWLLEYFVGEKDKLLNQLSRRDVIKFIEWVAAKRSEVTANRCLSLLSVVLTRALDLEYIERNPCRGVKGYREPESRSRIFSDDEYNRWVKSLIKNIDHLHSKILYVLTIIPLRFQEVTSMKWSRIDLENGMYFIPDSLSKNRRGRAIALNRPAVDLLTQMSGNRDPGVDWVFPANSDSGHVVNIRVQFKKVLKEAGIIDFRTHDCRRSGSSALLNDFDVNPLKIMQILGHRSMQSTMVYARLSAKSMTETSDLLGQKFEEVANA